jgi:hypothetical protein
MEQSMPPLDRIAFDSPCPFEPLAENFSTKSLNEKDKEWLGAQLYYEKITSLDLSKKYGVPASTIRRYKSKIVKMNIFRIRAGRPPLLDEIPLLLSVN